MYSYKYICIYVAGTKIFEIIEGNTAVVTGEVRIPTCPAQETVTVDCHKNDEIVEEIMKTKDIYKEFKLRGYQYSGVFRSIKSSNTTGTHGHISWLDNWVAFMDNMLQMHILKSNTTNLYIPTGIQKLTIDPMLHTEYIQSITTEDKRTFSNHIYLKISIDIFGYHQLTLSFKRVTITIISTIKTSNFI